MIVTGSQDWDNAAIVWLALERVHQFDPGVLLVSGACPRGADLLCETSWADLGGEIERHPAAWYPGGRYDGMAGIRRNQEMADLGAWGCLAFGLPCERRACAGKPADEDWPFHVTHGTGHCSRYAKARGIAVRRFTPVSPA
jgi:YspA, cpYpsA-related SLOG family